ncbi:hypothetical protein Y900_031145 [Mycolicibacterium aromaticivorans JS19b1 = JCM 16368]|uniref:Uncharacterized protein n=1 Tax=Mycolicibacterium aromaticivorans JS19b1 = JCM 16368 TaxID=1440774 RepID=A0A064C7P7_9MYCO|nr:hypothetical protein [Mycolicibacterium aromaticivorans]KDE96653.1 hypothetical protein Y900_031020 [Mycolicibacterium aromaticivorans JS19b1 = JCM 16368]KDE96674.1 hypothetical protein Y900_031145 [Mycolicibacterium aromaticivorans JS19b1 = JCM 16368]
MNAKQTTADQVRSSIIRRPVSTAPSARAAETFHPVSPTTDPPRSDAPPQRTTVVYPAQMRLGLKSHAATRDTTVTELVRLAATDGLTDAAALAQSSRQFQGVNGRRSTVDLPADLHKTLKVTAAQYDTSVQALLLAAVHGAYPELSA